MEINYQEVSEKYGWSVEEVKNGYAIFLTDYDVEVVQKIDDLDRFGLGKFESDTEAGEQALKDGHKLFTSKHKDLVGWYILDTPKNRDEVRKIETNN